jgi:hypothetical protein
VLTRVIALLAVAELSIVAADGHPESVRDDAGLKDRDRPTIMWTGTGRSGQ